MSSISTQITRSAAKLVHVRALTHCLFVMVYVHSKATKLIVYGCFGLVVWSCMSVIKEILIVNCNGCNYVAFQRCEQMGMG